MFYKHTIVALALLASATLTTAQESLKPCITSGHHASLLKQYPQIADIEQQFNRQMQQAAMQYRATTGVDTVTYDIPVVVHVVHDYDVENVPDTLIYGLVSKWTTYYMKRNADTASVAAPFVPWIGNPKMRFHLATIDPYGNPTKGVTRIQSHWTKSAYDRSKFQMWPNNKYLNIWIVSSIYSSSAAAYSMFPSDAAVEPYYDGIICMASQLNTNPLMMEHEIGHSLNLQHVWGNINIGSACGDDLVDDTPPTKGHNFVCPLSDTECAVGNLVHYIGAGGADSVVDYPDTTNTQNIMEYASCRTMFTKGQVVRMRSALTSSVAGRNNLITPANLAATGAMAPMPDLPPVADFYVSHPTLTAPVGRRFFLTANNSTAFVFRNASWNDTISNVQWAFSNGAQISSPVGATVNNRFSIPGWVTVSITATSNAGSNTLTDSQAVYVADTVATPVGDRYVQDFTTASSVDNWPIFNYYHNRFKWEHFTGTGIDDNTCLRYSSFDATSRITDDPWQDVDDFISPAFDLRNDSAGQPLYLNFYSAGASTNIPGTPGTETFLIETSSNGGVSWNSLVTLSGAALVNNGDQPDNFVPTLPSHWKARSFSIPATHRNARVFFRFRYNPLFNSNNFYIDKVMLSRHPVDVADVRGPGQQFSISPNPANNGFVLSFKTGITGDVSYTIRDITGKLVYQHAANFGANTDHQEAIGRDITPAAGMYLVTLTIDGSSSTQKLVVY